MPTTFVLLAIDHDPQVHPEDWNWSLLVDHPDPVGVVAHALAEDEPTGELLAARGRAARESPVALSGLDSDSHTR